MHAATNARISAMIEAQPAYHFKLAAVSTVKKGEYVRFSKSPDAPVWIRGEYDRTERRYSFAKADDMNRERFAKATALVAVGFTY